MDGRLLPGPGLRSRLPQQSAACLSAGDVASQPSVLHAKEVTISAPQSCRKDRVTWTELVRYLDGAGDQKRKLLKFPPPDLCSQRSTLCSRLFLDGTLFLKWTGVRHVACQASHMGWNLHLTVWDKTMQGSQGRPRVSLISQPRVQGTPWLPVQQPR